MKPDQPAYPQRKRPTLFHAGPAGMANRRISAAYSVLVVVLRSMVVAPDGAGTTVLDP